MAEVAKLNHRHEQIVNWLICNPHKSQGDCAKHFNYTQPWLSQVIHSDVFQARYQQRCKEVGVVAIHSIATKLNTVAALTLDKVRERLEAGVASERFLGDAMTNTLKMLGYGSPERAVPGDQPAQHNHLHVHADDIQRAREIAASAFKGSTPQKLTNKEGQNVDGGSSAERALLPAPLAS